MQLGKRVTHSLRERLAQAHVTQSALALKLGISQAAVSRRLTGLVPLDLNEVEVIAEVLGVDPGSLFDERPTATPREVDA